MEQILFNGEFAFVGSEISENGADWVWSHRDIDDGLYDWRFEQKSVLNLLNGNMAYGGIFSIRLGGHRPTQSIFTYYSSEKILCINHFEFSGGLGVHTDIYKVERAAEAELRLYPIEDDVSLTYNTRIILRAVR